MAEVTEVNRIGLLAGAGVLPVEFAKQARKRGFDVVAIGMTPDVNAELKQVAAQFTSIPITQWGAIVAALKAAQVPTVYFMGLITKDTIFKGLSVDQRMLSILHKANNGAGDALFRAIAEDLHVEGIEIGEQMALLSDLLPEPGTLTRREASPTELADVALAYKVAKEIARLDVGQTVVVKQQTVCAVEAVEGTNAALRRGGALGRGGVVAVKVTKPRQDLRFDVPTIGPETVQTMTDAGVRVLAFEALRTLILCKDETVRLADDANLTLLALDPAEEASECGS